MIKTCSLETAKLLNKAGFRQDTSLFYRVDEFGNVFERNANEDPLKMQKIHGTNIYYAKPTTDELLEELPDTLNEKSGVFGLWINSGVYEVFYGGFNETFKHESLPEALSQMWLWLKKEGLLECGEGKK